MNLGKRFASLSVALAVSLAASHAGAADGIAVVPADYRGTGVVVALLPAPSALHASRPVIIIHHDPIRPLMPETMEMPFIAASAALFDGLRPGDRIAFALRDTPDALLVVGIERMAR